VYDLIAFFSFYTRSIDRVNMLSAHF